MENYWGQEGGASKKIPKEVGFYRVGSGLTSEINTDEVYRVGIGPTNEINTVERGSTARKALRDSLCNIENISMDRQGEIRRDTSNQGKAMMDSLCNVESGSMDKQREYLIDTSNSRVRMGLTDTSNAVSAGEMESSVGTCNMKSAGWRSIIKTMSTAGMVDEEPAVVKYKKYATGDSSKTNIQEGGHALKSLLPEVQGGALHGAHDQSF